MNRLPVDLLNIVYEFIPRITDNDRLLERLHSVLCFDLTDSWFSRCDHSFDICRIRTDTDIHLVVLDFSCSLGCARLCVTDLHIFGFQENCFSTQTS